MRTIVVVSTFITLFTMSTLVRAQGNYMANIGTYYGDHRHSDESHYERSTLRYRDFGASTPQTRRLIKTGALMLGIAWGACAGITLSVLMTTGESAVAQMAIPFYATSGWAVQVFDTAPGAGMLLMVPTIVQSVGAILIIAGLVKRHRLKKRIMAGVAPIVLPKGGGMGISFSM